MRPTSSAVIVDYGLGNLASVRNMLRKAGYEATITAEPAAIAAAPRLLLPGVGAFDHGMRNLADRQLLEPLHEAVVRRRVPVLGICLGLQLMTRRSEEGQLPGLGWLAADTVRFRFDDASRDLRVPHMGWNAVKACRPTFLADALPDDSRFYFVHSFHVRFDEPSPVALAASYGGDVVAAAVCGNVAGTQFHPEKSHRFGLAVMRAFMQWSGE